MKPALHRFPGSMAKRTQALCRHLADEYDGDASLIWKDVTTAADLLDHLPCVAYSVRPGPPPEIAFISGNTEELLGYPPEAYYADATLNPGGVRIGTAEIYRQVETVAEVSGKTIHIKHVEGPVGVQSRNFSNERIYSIGWQAKVYLEDGIAKTYPWVEQQVIAARGE